jgi:AraC family transcriptional regulator of adaptative response/methylated-DNA-[protein]-cysteine methyltransferase
MGVDHNRQIGYHISDSPLGRLLIAATSKGLCGLMWGDRDQELLEALADRLRRHTLRRGLEKPERWFDPVNRFLAGEPVDLSFPLDPGGSAFQRTVWARIQEIPLGRTLTYARLAEALASPGAARAVAGACAANPVALVIPCHRVIRSDGGLGGYRWGLQRKRRLLSLEASMAADGPWKLTAPAGPERAEAALRHPHPEHGPWRESGNP